MSKSPADARRCFLAAVYDGTVDQRRQTAIDLAEKYGEQLILDERIDKQLKLLLKRVAQLNTHMQERMQLGDLCSRCASREDGGCCSRYMAGETDSLQLLMNILAGVAIAACNDNDGECCYLGAKGCIFPIKPMFCLNYNCRQIISGAPAPALAQLLQLAGLVLNSQYKLEQLLIEILTAIAADRQS